MTKNSGTSSAVSLTLDTELRLLPHQLNLGKAELLTDALTLPFTDIESRLGYYALSSSGDEKKSLTKRMKNYLGRLNANPHIPLSFRLKVLRRFEQELDLFDAEMTAAILNAHKIGIVLVQEVARSNDSYYSTLVDMVANAIELAVKLLLMNLEQYRAPSVIVTRQFFDLARLGLDVSSALGDASPSKTARLYKAISNHEILRKVDLFAHTHIQQQYIWQELQCHIGTLRPILLRSGSSITDASNVMLVNLNRPNDPGRITRQAQNPVGFDCIVFGLDTLSERLNKAIRSIEAVLSDQQMQKKALHTEQALKITLIGGKAILAALRNDKRDTARTCHTEARVQIYFNLPKAILKAFTMPESGLHPSQKSTDFNQAKAWNLVDYNQTGICLERMHTASISELPGYLVGLKWGDGKHSLQRTPIAWRDATAEQNPQAPSLGFIRWAKVLKAGEQRIGIEFFSTKFKLAKAVMAGGDKSMNDKCTWPVLVQLEQSPHMIIFPETKVYKHMTFMVLQDNQHAHFKISSIMNAGQNYSLCNIIRAKPR